MRFPTAYFAMMICCCSGGGGGLVACSAAEPSVTASEFRKIAPEMSYNEVVTVIGFSGRIVQEDTAPIGSIVPSGDPDEKTYVWQNTDKSNVSVVFRNGKSVSAAQWNLCRFKLTCRI